MRDSRGADSDGETNHRGDGERRPPFVYARMEIGCRQRPDLFGYPCDIAGNGGFGRGQGILRLDTQSAQLRIGRCREPPEKTLNAADEGFYRFHTPRSSGVVQYPQFRRNYPSVHECIPDQPLRSSMSLRPNFKLYDRKVTGSRGKR